MDTNTAPITTIHHGVEAVERLAEVGIPLSPLWAGLRNGLLFKASLTTHDTQAIRGIGTWNAVHRGLADASVRHGWVKREHKLFAVIEHPAGGLAIGVLAGDSTTGRVDSEPRNAAPILPGYRVQTRKRIALNLLVTGYRSHFSSVSEEWVPPLTYFLVHHIKGDTGEIQGELSLPTRLDGDYITEWHERIMLPPPESEASVVEGSSLLDDEGDPFDINITEKAV